MREQSTLGGNSFAVFLFCVVSIPGAGQKCADNVVFGVHKENVDITIKEAAEYKPGSRNYYVRDFNDSENVYLKAALSPKRRKEWLDRWQDRSVPPCIEPVLNQLAAVAKRTLPTYRPTGFPVRNAAEEKLLLTAINDISSGKVLGSGLTAADWEIQKRRNGIPDARFKRGMVYAKFATSDDGFCRIVHVNLIQDYAGGGTFAATKARFIKTEPAGCP